MGALIVFSILVVTSSLIVANEQNNVPPSASIAVDVYYEALCPDSKKFFKQQLQGSLDLIHENNVQLNFIPFGKATYELDPSTNQWVFTCRHTPTECEGHKIHACALDKIQEPRIAQDFITCLMEKGEKGKPYPGQECAGENVDYTAIDQCANSAEVDEKIVRYKEMTAALQPPIKSVPVIVFNAVYKQEDQDLAVKNFKGALCRYLKLSSPDLHACLSSSQGHRVTLTLLLSALAAIFLAYF